MDNVPGLSVKFPEKSSDKFVIATFLLKAVLKNFSCKVSLSKLQQNVLIEFNVHFHEDSFSPTAVVNLRPKHLHLTTVRKEKWIKHPCRTRGKFRARKNLSMS